MDETVIVMVFTARSSSVQRFERCQRRWRYSEETPEPMTAALEIGTAVHKCLEEWLRDGTPFPATKAGIIAKKGLPFLPPPSKDLRVEITDIVDVAPGIQFRRTIDLFDPQEPRLYDHKTFTDAKWIPAPEALLGGVQSTSYAMWGLDHLGADTLAATWLYYPKAGGNAVPVELTFTREHTAARWAQTLSNTVKMADLLDKSPAACDTNYEACNDYNKRCPFYEQCRGKKGDTIMGLDLLSKMRKNLSITEAPAAPSLLERQLQASILPPDAPPDTYEAMPAEEPKKTRAKRVAQPVATPAHMPTTSLELWIGAMRDGQPHIKLEQWVGPIADAVAENAGVSHFGLVEYGKGAALLSVAVAAHLDTNPPTLPVFVDRVPSAIGKAVLEVLVRRAGNNILRGV